MPAADDGVMKARGERWFDWGLGVAAVVSAYGLAFVVWTAFHWGGDSARTTVVDVAFTPVNLLGALLAWRAAHRLAGDPRRRAWLLISAALGVWWLGDVNWAISDLVRHTTPFPSWSDVGYLAFYPLLMAGLLTYPAAPRRRGERLKLTLDVATVVIAGAMVVWFVAIGPTTQAGNDGLLPSTVTLAYPVGDLVVIFAVVVLMLRGISRADKTVLSIALAAIGLFVAADLAYARLSLNSNYQAGSWPDACWMLAQCLLVGAAALQGRRAGADAPPVPTSQPQTARVSRLPYLAMAIGIVLVGVVALKTAENPLNGLIVGTVLLVAVVMVRQLLAQRENVRLLARTTALAATDTLTGLTNRRTFFEEAHALLAHAHASGQSVSALMIDVDDFKHVNDTYGHAAGDLVLHTIGIIGCQHIRSTDLLARYGGDEFVALLPSADLDAATRVAQRFADAVAAQAFNFDDHTDVTLTLSIGAACAQTDQSLTDLLARADHALYDAKRAGRARVHT